MRHLAVAENLIKRDLKYAECMRPHGLVNFPDPLLTHAGLGKFGRS